MSDPKDDLYRHTADRMAEVGADAAKNAARRKLISEIKERVPKFLWPLIPGQGGSVGENVEKMAKRKLSDWLWGIGCSLAFFAIFGVAVCGFGATVLYAVW